MSANPWHKVRKSSFWGGTYTSWCGQTVRKRDVETPGLLRWAKDCPACKTAKKSGRAAR